VDVTVQDSLLAGAPVVLAFCPSCAGRLVDGWCAAHGAPRPASARPVQHRARTAGAAATRPWTRRWPVAVAASAVVVAGAVVAATLAGLRGDVARLEEANAAARLDADVQAGLLAAADQAVGGLSRRLSDLEAALAATPDPAAVASAVQRSVFTVTTDDGEGSAWAVTEDRVITNFHVVADGWVNGRPSVTLQQDDRTWAGTVVEVSPADDLAVIAVDGPSFEPLGRSGSRPQVGDPVLVVGSPLGLGGTVASGIVSSYRTEDGLEYLQFSAPVSPGSSGGPVVDGDGQVIGVAVAKLVGFGAEGLSFAIPVTRACEALEAC
jgi:putative serine protease PepD